MYPHWCLIYVINKQYSQLKTQSLWISRVEPCLTASLNTIMSHAFLWTFVLWLYSRMCSRFLFIQCHCKDPTLHSGCHGCCEHYYRHARMIPQGLIQRGQVTAGQMFLRPGFNFPWTYPWTYLWQYLWEQAKSSHKQQSHALGYVFDLFLS